MRIVVFGLSVSSSWGNGHATLWRGLIQGLARRRHRVTFFEWDAPYYAAHRDCAALVGADLCLYADWPTVRPAAGAALRRADVAIVTSYCPHGREASALVLESRVPRKVLYDLDTPITLDRLSRKESVEYLPARGLSEFDLVLSYTGGEALTGLARALGARRVAPLYGGVDPGLHAPRPPLPRYQADLSYLGTYAPERQAALRELFVAPAAHLPGKRLGLAGSQYPPDFPWQPNIFYFAHLPPVEHASFYCSARLNLNVTREPMARLGYCPSGRLFEAAACQAGIITDLWPGLEEFYEPDVELLVARDGREVEQALMRDDGELAPMRRRARERTLDQHTLDHRAGQLVRYLEHPLQSTAQHAAGGA